MYALHCKHVQLLRHYEFFQKVFHELDQILKITFQGSQAPLGHSLRLLRHALQILLIHQELYLFHLKNYPNQSFLV